MSQSQPADPLPALVQDADRLHARIASEVMGWEVFDVGYFGMDASPRQQELHDWMDAVGIDSVGLYYIDVATDFWQSSDDFEPSSDWSAIRLVEDEIERRGLGMRYLAALCRLVLTSDEMDDREWADREVLKVFRASCEQRCKAALAVCGATP